MEVQNPTHLRNGEYALLLSHKKALERAKEDKLKQVVILEDDFCFVDDVNERLAELSNIPDHWDVIYLGANHYHLGAGRIPPTEISPGILRVYSSFTTHAMIVKDTVYDEVLSSIDKLKHPLDIIYCDVQLKYNAFGFAKNLCKQIDGHSDIIGFDPHYNRMGVYG